MAHSLDPESFCRSARIDIAVSDVLTQIYRDILELHSPCKNILIKVMSCGHFQKNFLHEKQIQKLKNAQTLGYGELDITLMYSLLRNLCPNITPPTNGWDTQILPDSVEITTGDDIERIRIIRNEIRHRHSGGMSESDYMRWWKEIYEICQRQQQALGVEYLANLRSVECMVLDDKRLKSLKEEVLYSKSLKIFMESDEGETQVKSLSKFSAETLSKMVDCINEKTTDLDISKVYETFTSYLDTGEPIEENQVAMDILNKLEEKIHVYASLKKYKAIKILDKFGKFISLLQKEYGVNQAYRSGSIIMTLGFYEEHTLRKFVSDFEKGKIQKRLEELMRFPELLSIFNLNPEHLQIVVEEIILAKEEEEEIKEKEEEKEIKEEEEEEEQKEEEEAEGNLCYLKQERDYLTIEERIVAASSGYGTESLTESLVSTSITPQFVSCKSHQITTIKYNLEGAKNEKNVGETSLNSKLLAHILSHQECLKSVNGKLKDDLKMTIQNIPGDLSALEVTMEHGEMESLKLEEMCNVINNYCREHLKIIEFDMEEERFSFGDLKLGKFLQGMADPNCVSIFFDGKLFLTGHEAEIAVFERDILSVIMEDEVVRDSFSIEQEKLIYLKALPYDEEISKKFTVEVVLEVEGGSGIVALRGLREDVVNVERHIRGCLQNYHKRFWTRPLKRIEQCLIQEKEVIRHLKRVFKKHECSYFIPEDCSILYVTSKISDMDILQAKLENELFVEMNQSLSKVEKVLFESQQWAKHYNILRNNTKKQVIIKVEGDALLVTCLPQVQILAQSCWEGFLGERIKSEMMEWGCSVEVEEIVQNVKHEEVLQIMKSMEDSIEELFVKDDGIHLKGTIRGIEKCKQELKTFISSVKYRKKDFAIASQEVVNHFLTPEGKRELQKIQKKTHSVIHMKNFCKIKMEQGNLADDNGDIIVNSVYTDTSSKVSQSTVAKAVFEKGGDEVQKKLVEKTNGRMQYGDVVETEAGGRLLCKVVYHACLPESTDQPQREVKDIAMECLKRAGGDHHTSISFPALGTGTYNYPPDSAAKGLLDAIVEYTRNTTSLLEKVTIVLFTESKRSVKEAFQQEYQRRCLVESGSTILTLDRGCIESGKFTVVSESEPNLQEAKRCIDELIATIIRNPQV